jgi:hypothetical protein
MSDALSSSLLINFDVTPPDMGFLRNVDDRVADVCKTANKSFTGMYENVVDAFDTAGTALDLFRSGFKKYTKIDQDLNKMHKKDPVHGFVKKDVKLVGQFTDKIEEVNKALTDKNKLHQKQNDHLEKDEALINGLNKSIKKLTGNLGDTNEASAEMAQHLTESYKSYAKIIGFSAMVWRLALAADKATQNFVTTNFRLYDSQQGLVQQARELTLQTGVMSEKSMEAVAALSNLATPKEQMKDLGESLLKANQFLGVSIGDLAEFSRQTRFAGGDVKSFTRTIQHAGDAMRKYGLSSVDVSGILQDTEVSAIDLTVAFGEMSTRTRDEAGNLVKTFEVFKQAQLDMGGVAKSLGMNAKVGSDALNELMSPKRLVILSSQAERLGIAMKGPEDALYGAASVIDKMTDAQNFSLEAYKATKDFTKGEGLRLQGVLDNMKNLTGLSKEQVIMFKEISDAAKKAGVDTSNALAMEKFIKARKDGIDKYDESMQTLTGQIGMLSAKFKSLWDMVNSLVGSSLLTFFNVIRPAIEGVMSVLQQFMYMIQWLNSNIPGLGFVIKMVTGAFLTLAPAIVALKFAATIAGILNLTKATWVFVKGFQFLTFVMRAFMLSNPLGQFIAAVMLAGAVIGGLYKHFETVRWIVDGIWQFFKNFPGVSLIVDLVAGIWDTLTSLMPGLSRIGKLFYDNLVLPVQQWLGIASPSKVMMKIGQFVIDGFWAGLKAIFGIADWWYTTLWNFTFGWVFGKIDSITEIGGKLVDAFWDGLKSIGKFANWWYTTLWNYTFGWVLGTVDNITEIGDKLVDAFWDGLKNIGRFANWWYKTLWNYTFGWVLGTVDNVAEIGGKLVDAFWNGLKNIGRFADWWYKTLWNYTFGWLFGKVNSVREIGKKLVAGFYKGMEIGLNIFKNLPSKLYNMGKKMVNGLYNGFAIIFKLFDDWHTKIWNFTFGRLFGKTKSVAQAARNMVKELYDGFVSALNKLDEIGTTIWNNTFGRLFGKISSMKEIGSYLIQGLKDGILLSLASLTSVGQWVYDNTIGVIADWLGIASPSTKMIEIGNNLMAGLKEGIEQFPGAKTLLKIGGKILDWMYPDPPDASKVVEGVDSLTNTPVPTNFGEDYNALLRSISDSSIEFTQAIPFIDATLQKLMSLQFTLGLMNFSNFGKSFNAALMQLDVTTAADKIVGPMSMIAGAVNDLNDAINTLATDALDGLKKAGPELKNVFAGGIKKPVVSTISKVQVTTAKEDTVSLKEKSVVTLATVVEKLNDLRVDNMSLGHKMLNVMNDQLMELRDRKDFSTNYNAWMS